jgi:hypothetical protein
MNVNPLNNVWCDVYTEGVLLPPMHVVSTWKPNRNQHKKKTSVSKQYSAKVQYTALRKHNHDNESIAQIPSSTESNKFNMIPNEHSGVAHVQ